LGAMIAKVTLNLIVVPWLGAPGAAAVTSAVYVGLLALKAVWFVRVTGTTWRMLFLLNGSDISYLRGRLRAMVRGRAALTA
jgi:hypothetical protein